MVKFGLNLLLWTTSVDESIRPLVEQIRDWGYDGVELPIFSADEKALAAAGQWLDDLGMERTAVTVCVAEENPISNSVEIRRAAVERLKRVVDGAAAAGARLLCGPIHSALGQFTGRGPTSDEWKWGQESLAIVADHAEKVDVMLAIEPLNRFECYLLNTSEDCARFVREVDHRYLKMMYDTFHAHIEEKDVAKAVRSCSEYLVHVHLSENDRSTPGTGAVDWTTTFAALREIDYQGWMTVEAFGLVLPELAAATKIWRRMYDSEESLAKQGLQFVRNAWSQVG
jgi:D-psicose/D-tagatose/L-ribulose 3-epimerase